DFQRLGPSIFRVIEVWLNGYCKLKDSPNPFLARKAQRFAREVRKSYPVFLAGRLLGPNPEVRRWIGELERRAWRELGRPSMSERALSVAAVGAALWTSLTLKLGLFQHPRLTRTAYHLPEGSWRHFGTWEELDARIKAPGLSVQKET